MLRYLDLILKSPTVKQGVMGSVCLQGMERIRGEERLERARPVSRLLP